MSRFAAVSMAAKTSASGACPSPGTIFSETAWVRWVDAIRVVLSGVTKPRITARPASISSAAINMSTSPAAGASAKTGACSPAGAISR